VDTGVRAGKSCQLITGRPGTDRIGGTWGADPPRNQGGIRPGQGGPTQASVTAGPGARNSAGPREARKGPRPAAAEMLGHSVGFSSAAPKGNRTVRWEAQQSPNTSRAGGPRGLGARSSTALCTRTRAAQVGRPGGAPGSSKKHPVTKFRRFPRPADWAKILDKAKNESRFHGEGAAEETGPPLVGAQGAEGTGTCPHGAAVAVWVLQQTGDGTILFAGALGEPRTTANFRRAGEAPQVSAVLAAGALGLTPRGPRVGRSPNLIAEWEFHAR